MILGLLAEAETSARLAQHSTSIEIYAAVLHASFA
jgi:hypothetical protein